MQGADSDFSEATWVYVESEVQRSKFKRDQTLSSWPPLFYDVYEDS